MLWWTGSVFHGETEHKTISCLYAFLFPSQEYARVSGSSSFLVPESTAFIGLCDDALCDVLIINFEKEPAVMMRCVTSFLVCNWKFIKIIIFFIFDIDILKLLKNK